MKELLNYIDKYGSTTFDDLKVTEIDIMIFSQIVYLSFNEIISNNEESITFHDAIKKYLKNINKYDMKRAVNLVKAIMSKRRYKNMLLSNYVYKLTDNEQFSAMCIDINDIRYVVFEGTDSTITGWIEDFVMSYKFPVSAHIDAIDYLNKVSKGASELIVLGHSKGGNLALVSSMYAGIFTRYKIKRIYSFDGPGLHKREINSLRYRTIKKKYRKYIPRYSVVGKLFEDDVEEIIVDSRDKGFLAHSVFKWKIDDKKLKRSEQSNFSLKFDKVFTSWLNSYTREEKEYFCKYIEKICENNNINNTYDIIKMDKEKYLSLTKKAKQMDPKFKQMLKEFLAFTKEYFITDTKNQIFKKIGLIKEDPESV